MEQGGSQDCIDPPHQEGIAEMFQLARSPRGDDGYPTADVTALFSSLSYPSLVPSSMLVAGSPGPGSSTWRAQATTSRPVGVLPRE